METNDIGKPSIRRLLANLPMVIVFLILDILAIIVAISDSLGFTIASVIVGFVGLLALSQM